MAFNNKLFYLGDVPSANAEPYRDFGTTEKITGMQSGSPISAADFNTIIRNTSLVTYSLMEIISNPKKVNLSEENDLNFAVSKEKALELIKNSLKEYIENQQPTNATNVVTNNPITGSEKRIVYNDANGTHLVTSEETSPSAGISKTVLSSNGTDTPSLVKSEDLLTRSSKYIRKSDGKDYELDFKLNGSTLHITFKSIN